MTPIAGTLVLAACTVCGAGFDIWRRQLPNWLSGLTALSGLAVVGLEQGISVIPWAVAHSLVALVVGAALFHFKIIGGGDGKFYAACAAWMPLQDGALLLLAVSLAGFLVASFWFTLMHVRRTLDERQKGKFAMVPYGLAIAGGAVFTRVLAG